MAAKMVHIHALLHDCTLYCQDFLHRELQMSVQLALDGKGNHSNADSSLRCCTHWMENTRVITVLLGRCIWPLKFLQLSPYTSSCDPRLPRKQWLERVQCVNVIKLTRYIRYKSFKTTDCGCSWYTSLYSE